MIRFDLSRHELLHSIPLGWFELHGYPPPRSVTHIGIGRDAYELQFYDALALDVIAFDPLYDGPDTRIYKSAVGFDSNIQPFYYADGDGQQSTCLQPKPGGIAFSHGESVTHVGKVTTYPLFIDNLYFEYKPGPHALIIDVQGYELQVLINSVTETGNTRCLDFFSYACIECSREPQYIGAAHAQTVVDYMAVFGFTKVWPEELPEHGDVYFVRKEKEEARP